MLPQIFFIVYPQKKRFFFNDEIIQVQASGSLYDTISLCPALAVSMLLSSLFFVGILPANTAQNHAYTYRVGDPLIKFFKKLF